MTETVRDPVDVRRSTRRWQIAGVWVFLVLVLSFPAYRLTESSRRSDAEVSQNAAQIAAGQQLWGENCATCHGTTGEGITAPALNSQEFLASVTDQQIAGIIEGGVPGSEMPAWLADYGARSPSSRSKRSSRTSVRGSRRRRAGRIGEPRKEAEAAMGGRVRILGAAWVLLVLTGCLQSGAGGNTVAMIPGYQGSSTSVATAQPLGYPPTSNVIRATLADTSSTQMSITLSQDYAPAGKVTFLITNAGTMGHEMVVLKTDQPADSFKITGFEGEPDRFNEDAKGLTNVGETGDPAMKPGTSMMLTIDMAQGHYAIVCNLNGHYAAGMHQDFWVTPAGSTPVTATLADTSIRPRCRSRCPRTTPLPARSPS